MGQDKDAVQREPRAYAMQTDWREQGIKQRQHIRFKLQPALRLGAGEVGFHQLGGVLFELVLPSAQMYLALYIISGTHSFRFI